MELGHRQHDVEQPDRRLHAPGREPRLRAATLFPFVDILEGGTAYTSFGSEPFTPNNELRYNTFQLQDNFTKFSRKHSLTFGGDTREVPLGQRLLHCCTQSAYVYNSLADFYADANGFLANPNRTTSPVTLRRFQVRYINIPGLEKPLQPLDVWYSGGYAQDEWRPRSEPDGHRRPALRRAVVREHRLTTTRTPTR